MDMNKSEINVGDFVLIEDTLHEILAVKELHSRITKFVQYSIAYANGVCTKPTIQTRLHYKLENLNINSLIHKESSITEGTIDVVRVADVAKSKYGSPYE